MVSVNEPLALIVDMLSEAVPVFLRVTDCAALVVPMVTLPKLREVGLRLATGVFEVLDEPKNSPMAVALDEMPG